MFHSCAANIATNVDCCGYESNENEYSDWNKIKYILKCKYWNYCLLHDKSTSLAVDGTVVPHVQNIGFALLSSPVFHARDLGCFKKDPSGKLLVTARITTRCVDSGRDVLSRSVNVGVYRRVGCRAYCIYINILSRFKDSTDVGFTYIGESLKQLRNISSLKQSGQPPAKVKLCPDKDAHLSCHKSHFTKISVNIHEHTRRIYILKTCLHALNGGIWIRSRMASSRSSPVDHRFVKSSRNLAMRWKAPWRFIFS